MSGGGGGEEFGIHAIRAGSLLVWEATGLRVHATLDVRKDDHGRVVRLAASNASCSTIAIRLRGDPRTPETPGEVAVPSFPTMVPEEYEDPDEEEEDEQERPRRSWTRHRRATTPRQLAGAVVASLTEFAVKRSWLSLTRDAGDDEVVSRDRRHRTPAKGDGTNALIDSILRANYATGSNSLFEGTSSWQTSSLWIGGCTMEAAKADTRTGEPIGPFQAIHGMDMDTVELEYPKKSKAISSRVDMPDVALRLLIHGLHPAICAGVLVHPSLHHREAHSTLLKEHVAAGFNPGTDGPFAPNSSKRNYLKQDWPSTFSRAETANLRPLKDNQRRHWQGILDASATSVPEWIWRAIHREHLAEGTGDPGRILAVRREFGRTDALALNNTDLWLFRAALDDSRDEDSIASVVVAGAGRTMEIVSADHGEDAVPESHTSLSSTPIASHDGKTAWPAPGSAEARREWCRMVGLDAPIDWNGVSSYCDRYRRSPPSLLCARRWVLRTALVYTACGARMGKRSKVFASIGQHSDGSTNSPATSASCNGQAVLFAVDESSSPWPSLARALEPTPSGGGASLDVEPVVHPTWRRLPTGSKFTDAEVVRLDATECIFRDADCACVVHDASLHPIRTRDVLQRDSVQGSVNRRARELAEQALAELRMTPAITPTTSTSKPSPSPPPPPTTTKKRKRSDGTDIRSAFSRVK